MARYKLTISGIFDSDNCSGNSDRLITHLVQHCCPRRFGFNVDGECYKNNCVKCWEHALESGVKNGVKSVHVRRLD